MKNSKDTGLQPKTPFRIKLITKFFISLLFVITTVTGLRAQTGQQYELSGIHFTGNDYFSTAELQAVIYSKESPLWVWQFINSVYSKWGKQAIMFDSTVIDNDIRALRAFYNANGFFKSGFQASYKLDTVKKKATIDFVISEGVASYYRNIRYFGTEKVPPDIKEELFKNNPLDSGKQFSQFVVKSFTDQVLQAAENNGYITVRFDSVVVFRDTLKNRTDLDIYFYFGDRYTISEVRIDKRGEGKDYVEPELLNEIIGIKPGDSYSLEKIRQSQVRLYRTGLFSSAIINPLLTDTVNRTVPLELTGTIGKMNELAPEIIMNNQQNSFNTGISGTYIRKNFIGRARKLQTSGSAGIQDVFNFNLANLKNTFSIKDSTVSGFLDATVRIEEPYIFQKPIFGILETYYKINKDKISGKRNYGAKLSFEFELPSYTFFNFLTAYYNYEVAEEIFADGKNTIERSDAISVLGADTRSVKTDNPLFPTRGYNLSLIFEEANLIPYFLTKLGGSSFDGTLFYKLMGSIAFYYPLSRSGNSVFGFKVKAGNIGNYMGGEDAIPSTRKFVSGGSNSIRGWRARELAPATLIYIDTRLVSAAGGLFTLEGSLEYRYKIINEIGAVLFTDFGNTWERSNALKVPTLAVASGFGFRYYSQIAPFRIDFGFKVYDPSDTRSILKKEFFNVFEFHFGIGEAF